MVVLHRHAQGSADHRYVTNSVSDVILELEQHVDGTSVSNYLHMPKCRGAGAVDERLKVTLKDGLRIDTSRDIA